MRRLLLTSLLTVTSACAPVITTDGGGTSSNLTSSTVPHKYSLVVGGASSLDDDLDRFGAWSVKDIALLDPLGWQTTLLFSDGLDDVPIQMAPVAQMSQRFSGVPAAFTAASFTAALTQLAAEVASGDEVLLTIATHGFQCENGTPETLPSGGADDPSDPDAGKPETFCIELGAPFGAEFQLDQIQPLLDQIAAKGALIGLLVATCDSGNALRMANASTCVISDTGYGTSMNGQFYSAWVDHVQGGMTLDAAYRTAAPFTNDYDECDQACPDDPTKLCPMPCPASDQDTPWISSDKGYPADPCQHFTL